MPVSPQLITRRICHACIKSLPYTQFPDDRGTVCFGCIQKILSLADYICHVRLGPQGALFPQKPQPQLQQSQASVPPNVSALLQQATSVWNSILESQQPEPLLAEIQKLAKDMHQRDQALRARLDSLEQWKSQIEARMANAAPTITGQTQEGFQQQNKPFEQAPPRHTVSGVSQLYHVLASSAGHGNQQPQPSKPNQPVHPPPHTVGPAPTQTIRNHLPEQAHQQEEQHPTIKLEYEP
ncbi:hypothetical protein AtubIFM57258_001260 [Aspergillus tubingensis]|nr:hypothetical protein AtubIFM57258_001260 [Aspergillus tubingensis]